MALLDKGLLAKTRGLLAQADRMAELAAAPETDPGQPSRLSNLSAKSLKTLNSCDLRRRSPGPPTQLSKLIRVAGGYYFILYLLYLISILYFILSVRTF